MKDDRKAAADHFIIDLDSLIIDIRHCQSPSSVSRCMMLNDHIAMCVVSFNPFA
jgi:hypothetical protein